MIDTYRKHNVEQRYLEAYSREADIESQPEVEAALCECFRELLPSLKPEYAALIDRLELQPGEPGEVARQLDIQPNNLKVRRHRARHLQPDPLDVEPAHHPVPPPTQKRREVHRLELEVQVARLEAGAA